MANNKKSHKEPAPVSRIYFIEGQFRPKCCSDHVEIWFCIEKGRDVHDRGMGKLVPHGVYSENIRGGEGYRQQPSSRDYTMILDNPPQKRQKNKSKEVKQDVDISGTILLSLKFSGDTGIATPPTRLGP